MTSSTQQTATRPTATRSTATRHTARGTTARVTAAAALTGAVLLTVAAPQATAETGPAVPPALTAGTLAAAHDAATDTGTLGTLSRFFARDGAVTRAAAAPRIQGAAVPVRTLSPDFVAGKPGAAVAVLGCLALTAVSSDGQKASLWTVPKAGPQGQRGRSGGWQVVNIATGDDEARYAAAGARKLPGGTVFREPQIDAWFVHKGTRVLPLDQDAVRAAGTGGTTLTAYRTRVRAAYADKLPGSGYAHSGKAGGYAEGAVTANAPTAIAPTVTAPTRVSADQPAHTPAGTAPATVSAAVGPALSATSAVTATGALLALALCGIAAVRHRRHRRHGETT